jgi:hypothetical protein
MAGGREAAPPTGKQRLACGRRRARAFAEAELLGGPRPSAGLGLTPPAPACHLHIALDLSA